MRTEVPLTRTLDLSQSGEVARVEFDLPPAGPNATASLMLGLRVSSADAESNLRLSDALVNAGLRSRVHLTRLDGDMEQQVPLIRMSQDRRERVPVPVSGEVPGVTKTGVETTSMELAGLVDPARLYAVLMFAEGSAMEPGRYRLVIELADDHPALAEEDVVLLVAYFKKGK